MPSYPSAPVTHLDLGYQFSRLPPRVGLQRSSLGFVWSESSWNGEASRRRRSQQWNLSWSEEIRGECRGEGSPWVRA